MKDHLKNEVETELDNFSERGYLVFNNYYVDIDNMVPVPYIQARGMDVPHHHWLMGHRMSNCLRYILTEGFLIASYAYTDLYLKSKLKSSNPTNIWQCVYYIDQTSFFNDHEDNIETLEKGLKLIEQFPIYFMGILLPNKVGESPMSRAISKTKFNIF
jgi:hypothetical protein